MPRVLQGHGRRSGLSQEQCCKAKSGRGEVQSSFLDARMDAAEEPRATGTTHADLVSAKLADTKEEMHINPLSLFTDDGQAARSGDQRKEQ